MIGGLVVIVAVTTALALLSRETGGSAPDTPPEARTPSASIVRGVACPDLRDAATLFPADDRDAFAAAIERAGQKAEDALQRDGVVFGAPEKLALELWLRLQANEGLSDARLRELILEGVDRCLSPSDA